MAAAPSVQKVLTENFRVSQAQIGDTVQKAVQSIWDDGIDIGDIDSSWDDIKPQVTALVQRMITGSRESGKTYYNASRVAAGYDALPSSYVPSVPLTARRLNTVLNSTGPSSMKQFIGNGAEMEDALDMASNSLGSAVQNLVMSAARDYVAQASKKDPRSNGVQRITEGEGTCDFCQMMADLGVTPGGGGFHDNCQCTSEPSFEGLG